MARSTDDLYALVLDGAPSAPLHGECAEQKYGADFPSDATPVYYGDAWRHEVAGVCSVCNLFVDPEAT